MATGRILASLLAAVLLVAAFGCGGEGASDPAAGTETDGAALDGEGMEPRIVVEHPIDAPGRPAEGSILSVPPSEPAVAWVPHLPVADLETSLDFYQDLGFAVVSRQPDDGAPTRIELDHEGAHLVLVGQPPNEEGEAADGGEPASTVLHLVAEPSAPTRTVTDPDGHRLALPDDH